MTQSPRTARLHRLALTAVTVAAAAVLLAAAAACGSSGSSGTSASPSPVPSPSVTPVVVPSVATADILEAAKAGDLNGFLTAVGAAGLDSALRQNLPYTVLAPNDEAFQKVGLTELVKNVGRIKSIVNYHIIPVYKVTLKDLKKGHYEAMTNSGFPVIFTDDKGAVMVNDANVTKVIEGPTWSIFVIDKVLMPPPEVTPMASPPATP